MSASDQVSPRSAGVASPKSVPPIVIESGRYMCDRSMNAAAMSARASARSARKIDAACRTDVLPGSGRIATSAIASATAPPSSSTATYRGETRTPQQRARPPRRTQESTGTLSSGRIAAPQPGQCEAGRTTLMPRGTR